MHRLTHPSYAGQSLEVVALRVRERAPEPGAWTIRATFAVTSTLTAVRIGAAAEELAGLLPDHDLDLVAVSL